jgi:hypothetical protein
MQDHYSTLDKPDLLFAEMLFFAAQGPAVGVLAAALAVFFAILLLLALYFLYALVYLLMLLL